MPAAQRAQPVLDDGAVAALARLAARIEDHFGAPQDVEWVCAGGDFWIVQSRPITALPEPEADPPTDWSVPDSSAFYVRASIVEQLPDPLCPLFADLVDGSVTRSLHSVLREFLGSDVVRAGDLGLPTINGYAYYRYGRGALGRLMLRSPAALRLLTTSGARSGRVRWRDYSHPRYVRIVESWVTRPPRRKLARPTGLSITRHTSRS